MRLRCVYETRGDSGFAVFSIDPRKINKETGAYSEIVDIAANAKEFDAYINPTKKSNVTLPVCISAPQITARIRAQSGHFTLHGSQIAPLESYDPLKPLITKIFIPYTSTAAILDSLERVGVNESFVYPGLDSIAKDATRAALKRYESTRTRNPR